jgi:molybdopterin converting factor small subunit
VRIRLGSGLARLAAAPRLTVELEDAATVGDLLSHLARAEPTLGPALRSALPVVAGRHVTSTQALRHGDELALLLPVSGG